MPYIWGLDLSLACTGIAIFKEDGNIEKICSISTDDKRTHGQRLKTIADFVLSLNNVYPANKVVIERAFSRFNISTAVIYRVHGVINYLFAEVDQIYYPPKAIKAKILKGSASKKQIQDLIIKKCPGIVFANEDESDAFAVGITYFLDKNIINWEKNE